MRIASALLLAGCASAPVAPVPAPLPETLAWSAGGEAPAGAFLGLHVEENSSSSFDALAFEPGARVVRVVEQSPAARAGLQPGDVLLRFGTHDVNDPAALEALLAVASGTVELQLRRGDTAFAVPVTLQAALPGTLPAEPLWVADPARSRAGWATVPGGGARLASAAPGSPALDAGLAPGDEVVAVDGEPVLSGRDLVRELQTREPGDDVLLATRDGREVELELWEPPRRVTSCFIPILVDYEAAADGSSSQLEILDFWLFSLFRHTRDGVESKWELFEVLEYSSGVGELAP